MRRAIAALLFLIQAAPAGATGGIYCTSADEKITVSLSVSHTVALNVLAALVTVGDQTWSTTGEPQGAKPLEINQAFGDREKLLVDFAAEAAGDTIARLRAFNSNEADAFASGGVFSMVGTGAWVVDCSLQE